MKVEVELIKVNMIREGIEEEKANAIIQGVIDNIPEKEPKQHPKKQYAIIISDPNGDLPDKEFVGWAVQTEEDESILEIVDKVKASASAFNESKKGSKVPVRSIGEAIEVVPPRFAKPNKIWFKHKEPVFVIKTDNQL